MKPCNKPIAAFLLLVIPALLRAEPATDRKIESAAEASYNYRTVLAGHVDVKCSDGVVTLTGTVSDPDQRILAENTVQELPGVVRVDNRIEVEPAASQHTDAWIATRIRTTLLLKNNVSALNTKVEVNDGAVTLSGKADNLAQKELTSAYVRGIEGVQSVNNLLVLPEAHADTRTWSERIDDASITAQVKYALLTHKSTSALNTGVTTKDGVVTLQGKAASAAEKDLVTLLAQGVNGVRAVTNKMTVKG